MLQRTIRFGFIAGAILTIGSAVLAQGNLTAKPGSLQPQPAETEESDRMRDGLVGPVRRVRTETAKLALQGGRMVEGKRSILEVVSYDLKGAKVENQYFPVEGATLTGKEVYKYDDKGNISEMTLVDADGSLLSRETYKYDYDFTGNWTRMTTSVAVVDSGRVAFEPSEITYRSILYYLDASMARMVQPGAKPPARQPAAAGDVPKEDTESQADAGRSVTRQGVKQLSPSLPPASSANRLSGLNSSADVSAPATGPGPNDARVVMESEPPSPGPKPILKPVSGGVLNGTALSLPAPSYPDGAKRLGLSGLVSVEVIVDETGKVISARAKSGPSPLRSTAEQAALKARFSPTKLSGQPVKVSGTINYNFTLGR